MKWLVRSVLLGLLALCFQDPAQAADKKILLVQSYHQGYEWTDAITAGVQKALQGQSTQFEVFYMDTKRKNDNAWKEEAGKLAQQKIEEWKPDVVITGDDNATQYVAKYFANKPNAPQIVFCGVNAEASKYGYPAPNLTGILERPHFKDSIQMLLKISPNVKKVAFLSDDGETSTAVVQYLKTQKADIEVVSYDQPSTFDEWKSTVQGYQNKVDAFIINNYHTVKKTTGDKQSMPPKDVMDWTVKNNKLPTVAFFPFGIEDGLLCGIAESGDEHGYKAAQIALQMIQNNKTAKDFPITTAGEGIVMLNLRTAENLGIKVPYDVIKTAQKVAK